MKQATAFSTHIQYLNCKILHGGRFCSLDQLYKKLSGNDVLPLPKLNEDKKKVFAANWSQFSTKSGEGQKKKVFAAIRDDFRQEICRIL